jgi:gluconate 2-dehydrogenase gamma chain
MARLSRREALLATAAAAWTAPLVARAAEGALSWTPRALTPGQAQTLSVAAELIMPATDTPGAIAVGVPQFIDRALATWCEPADAERLRAGLARLDADAKAEGGTSFAALTSAQQTAIMTRHDAETARPHYFALLKDLTTAGYFTSRDGATKAVRFDANPGAYRGCVPLAEIGRAWAT